MLTSTRLNRSIDLVRGMARRTDTDLAASDKAARFQSVVLSCTDCGRQAACARLQAENAVLDAAPDYCRNRDYFA